MDKNNSVLINSDDTLMPSAIYLGAHGRRYFGREATEKWKENRSYEIVASKRLLGRYYAEVVKVARPDCFQFGMKLAPKAMRRKMLTCL